MKNKEVDFPVYYHWPTDKAYYDSELTKEILGFKSLKDDSKINITINNYYFENSSSSKTK